MMESDADVCERLLALHLGALYSCPAELTLAHSKSTNNTQGSTCGPTSFSARCFLPEELQRGASRGCEVNPADSTLLAAEDAPENASGPVREVFCTVLPQLESPADAMAGFKTGRDDGSMGLSEALGLMYGGVHVVYSPRPSTIGAAGAGSREEGGAMEEKAARPWSATPHLVPCSRFHAGLIPLYAPVVESADGTFLVRSLALT